MRPKQLHGTKNREQAACEIDIESDFGEAGQQRLTRDLEDVVRRFDRRGSVGAIAVPGMYLEVIGIKGQATPR